MEKYQHFILTRFNYHLYDGQKIDRDGRKINTRRWMDHRLKLFKKYCFPSLKSQTSQNFTWLVQFDPKTPKRYLKRLRKYGKYRNFVPIFSNFRDYLTKHLDTDTKYLITTRFDNDDALNIKAVELIQAQFKEQDCLLINFPTGYCWQDQEHKLFLIINSKHNAFISLIEKIKKAGRKFQIKTVRCIPNHRHLGRVGKIKQIKPKVRMWLQIIHEKNLMNRVRGIPVPKDEFSVENFGLSPSVFPSH